jgi:beta-mannosidase
VEGVFQYRHRQFVRKEQSDFGWDWGPAFVPAGPWQPVHLVQLSPSDLYMRNSLVDVYRQGQLPLLRPDQTKPWIVNASLDIIGKIPSDAGLTYDLLDLNERVLTSGNLTNVTKTATTITGSTVFSNESVRLWWPTGLGAQDMYLFRVNVTANQGRNQVLSMTKRIGFRTIVLNQEPIRPDQLEKGIAPGANWHFEINGKEFYAKGSNFIPPDAFWTRVTESRIRTLFDSVVQGNQNMLRVWSSGAYLPNFAYNIADGMSLLKDSEPSTNHIGRAWDSALVRI